MSDIERDCLCSLETFHRDCKVLVVAPTSRIFSLCSRLSTSQLDDGPRSTQLLLESSILNLVSSASILGPTLWYLGPGLQLADANLSSHLALLAAVQSGGAPGGEERGREAGERRQEAGL